MSTTMIAKRKETGSNVRALQRLLDRSLLEVCKTGSKRMDRMPRQITAKDLLNERLDGKTPKERIDELNKILWGRDSSNDMRNAAREELSRINSKTAPNVIW